MPYSSKETDMADFPFTQAHQAPNGATTGQAMQDPYLSTPSPPFFSYSDSSLPNASPTPPEYQSMNTYFPTPYDDINWSALEEVSDEASSNFTDVSPMGPSQYPNYYESSFARSSGHINVDLGKIIEFEKWDSFPPVQVETEIREVPTDSDSTISRGYSYPSSPSETPPLKRRRSSSGKPAYVVPLDAELDLAPEKASFNHFTLDKSALQKSCTENSSSTTKSSSLENPISKAKPKPSNRTSHSIIERKYRESLNSRIMLLDRTLASARQSKTDDEAGETTAPGKSRKADVLHEAVCFVKQARLESEARIKEIDFLRLRVAALEKLVGCGDCALLKQFAGTQITQRPTDY